MNILHVVNIYFVIPYFLGGQLKYFNNKGYKEYIICSPSEELELLSKKLNFSYKEIPILRKISLIRDIKSLYEIYTYIKINNINVVNGHTPKGGLLAMLAAFVARVPKRIYFRHGLVYETSTGIKRSMLINMDRLTSLLSTQIVCVSPSVFHRSLEHKLNFSKKQLVLFKGTCNGINLERFNKQNIDKKKVNFYSKEYKISEDDFVIGYTGRLVRDKGIIELVEAFLLLQRKHNNVKLLLVGMIEERDALPDNILQEIKNNMAIIHTGYVPNYEIEIYYSLMNIFVLLSYREGFPTSILEASALEIPVITTKATGCIDAIIENETGWFVKHNSNELTSKIEKLINDRELASNMGKAGQEFVEKNFDEKKVWLEIGKLYQ